ncbi:hypothetical protein [Xanthomonas sp. NCPPB 2632]|uniref:hypothetical protein n=1 Tax=Xanthomonas sp. NCPPB 2632 TaxID=3240912 RepID=UPI00351152DD
MRLHSLASFHLPLLVLASVFAPCAQAATHYLTLINDDAVPTVKVEAAPHGTSEFQALDTAGPLQGGRTVQVAAAFPDGVCAVDVRVSYAGRGPVLISGWNVCREPKLYLGQSRRAGLRRINAVNVPALPAVVLPTSGPQSGSAHD